MTDLIDKLYPEDADELREKMEVRPNYVRPIITLADAEKKYITRYFIRQTNDELFITEIDQAQYDNLKDNPRFIVTEVKWKIIGRKETLTYFSGAKDYGVADANLQAVSKADLTFGGLLRYIKDYTEFWYAER